MPKSVNWDAVAPIPIPANPRFMDLRRQKFGRLTPYELLAIRKSHPTWRCRCDCGNVAAVRSDHLKSGRQVSCGCFQEEIRGDAQRTHGEAHYPDGENKQTVEYTAWMMMRARCNNPETKRYDRYGGRGIRVCDRWENGENGLSGYECFLADMGRKPSPRHSIDRFPDNDGNYEPNNCRWATYSQQARNRADTVCVEFQGQTMALADACDIAGAEYQLVRGRMQRGWSFRRALIEPSHWRGG